MENDVFLKECYVTKVNQYGALRVWKSLGVSSILTLSVGENNEDIFFNYEIDEKNEEVAEKEPIKSTEQTKKIEKYKIGLLSKEDADPINKFLEAGRENEFECVISKLDEKADEDKRISVAIFIKRMK